MVQQTSSLKLLEVDIPRFRSLQNLNLTFERDLNPSIFPITSFNGGGKSTLLQLIFILFSCSTSSHQHHLMGNLLKTAVNSNCDGELLAAFSFLYEREIITFRFQIYKSNRKIDATSASSNIWSLHFHLNNDSYLLVCDGDGRDDRLSARIFGDIARRIFLAGCANQSYLFLSPQTRKYLLSDPRKHYRALIRIKENLPNLYIYEDAIATLMVPETEGIQCLPEDLSHGELKRLGLHTWIKYNIPEDSIVLIDDVESALHPEWQYNLVDELACWGNNQYLLGTHSFHLCEALTPKHVKEIP